MSNSEVSTKVDNWMSRVQFPHLAKKYGIWIAILSFLVLLTNGFTWNSEAVRIAGRYGLLIGFMIISLSREEIEDEFIIRLRMQSYRTAFIVAIGYALILPFIDYGLDAWFKSDRAEFHGLGDFEILWLLLSIQVLLFELLKRANR